MRKRYSRSYTVLSFLTMFSYRELPLGGSLLVQGFCCAKSFACGRAAERARAAACNTITASNGEGMPGGERIQVTMVFEKII